MKGTEKRKLFKNIGNGLLSVGKGIISIYNPVAGAAVGMVQGAVKGIQKEKDTNLASLVGGKGNIDWYHIGGVVIILGGGVAIAFGWLTFEDVKSLARLFMNLN